MVYTLYLIQSATYSFIPFQLHNVLSIYVTSAINFLYIRCLLYFGAKTK